VADYGYEDRWCFSTDRRAVVGTSGLSALRYDDWCSGNGFAWLAFGMLTVFSCYLRPGATLHEFGLFVSRLEEAIRFRGNALIILAGDLYAWNVEGA